MTFDLLVKGHIGNSRGSFSTSVETVVCFMNFSDKIFVNLSTESTKCDRSEWHGIITI